MFPLKYIGKNQYKITDSYLLLLFFKVKYFENIFKFKHCLIVYSNDFSTRRRWEDLSINRFPNIKYANTDYFYFSKTERKVLTNRVILAEKELRYIYAIKNKSNYLYNEYETVSTQILYV